MGCVDYIANIYVDKRTNPQHIINCPIDLFPPMAFSVFIVIVSVSQNTQLRIDRHGQNKLLGYQGDKS